MKIKEQIKTIINDFSEASLMASEYKRYNGFFKNTKTAESFWTYVKSPELLKVKGLLARVGLVKEGK